jgi:hypothetical protein
MLAHGFILDVAVDQTAPPPDVLGEKIADALQWIEGCGKVNVSYLGPMEPDEIV